MTVIIIGTVRLPPERLDDARPHMAAMVAASRAEDGCLAYAYGEDVLEPGLIRVSEAWRAAWSALGLHDRQLVAYDAGAPRPI